MQKHFFLLFEESLKKVSERSERKIALVVKGLGWMTMQGLDVNTVATNMVTELLGGKIASVNRSDIYLYLFVLKHIHITYISMENGTTSRF